MKALRTAKLVIDVPVPGAEPFIMGIIQGVVVDELDNVSQVIPRANEFYRKSSEILTDVVVIDDPVTQQQLNISGAGLQMAITAIVSKWLIEDCAKDGKHAYVNEFGRVIVEE